MSPRLQRAQSWGRRPPPSDITGPLPANMSWLPSPPPPTVSLSACVSVWSDQCSQSADVTPVNLPSATRCDFESAPRRLTGIFAQVLSCCKWTLFIKFNLDLDYFLFWKQTEHYWLLQSVSKCIQGQDEQKQTLSYSIKMSRLNSRNSNTSFIEKDGKNTIDNNKWIHWSSKTCRYRTDH